MITMVTTIALITMIFLVLVCSITTYILIRIERNSKNERDVKEVECITHSLTELHSVKKLYDLILDESFDEYLKFNLDKFNPDPSKNNYIGAAQQNEIVATVYANARDRISPQLWNTMKLAYSEQGLTDYTIRKMTIMTVEVIANMCNSDI